jgi:DNA topoisomerase-1
VDTPLGDDPVSGLTITLKKGPYGHYVQLGADSGELKPKRVALPRSMKSADVDLNSALRLLALPRELGRHPETGEPIVAGIGRFGPYIKHGAVFKSLTPDDDVLTIGVNRAVVLLAEPTAQRRPGPRLLRELGEHPDGGTVALYAGRYGPYVSHDGVFASLPRTADPDTFSLEQAVPLLLVQRQKGKGKPRRSRKSAAVGVKSVRAAKADGARARAPRKKTGKRKPPAQSNTQSS